MAEPLTFMTTPTPEEIKELQIWIAENVMSWSYDGINWCKHDKETGCTQDCIVWTGWFEPATDARAFKSLLAKCAEKLEVLNDSIVIGMDFDEENGDKKIWFISRRRVVQSSEIEADTLELALCLFAKKLFTK